MWETGNFNWTRTSASWTSWWRQVCEAATKVKGWYTKSDSVDSCDWDTYSTRTWGIAAERDSTEFDADIFRYVRLAYPTAPEDLSSKMGRSISARRATLCKNCTKPQPTSGNLARREEANLDPCPEGVKKNCSCVIRWTSDDQSVCGWLCQLLYCDRRKSMRKKR